MKREKTKRNFIYSYVVARAAEIILEKDVIGEIYNIGTDNEYTVLEIAEKLLKKHRPNENIKDCVKFIEDRPFNDYRHAINSDKLKELG